MSTSFTRSIRTLHETNQRAPIWRTAIASALFLAWLGWLLFAQIPVYETADTLQLLSPQRATALLPPDGLVHVQPGQPARIRLDDFAWIEYGLLHATVTSVDSQIRNGRIQIELTLNDAANIPLQRGLTGQVEIETDKLSPAALLIRAAGQIISGANTGETTSEAAE